MNDYELAELIGRQKFEKDFSHDYEIYFTQGEYDKVDFFATSRTLTGREYVGEIKNYEEERSFHKFENYMIDYWKLSFLKTVASARGLIPVLIVYFSDCTVLWDLTNLDIDSRREWRWVNKDGQNYGKQKEYALQTYLYEDEARWIRKE